jgi:hypothetical protein
MLQLGGTCVTFGQRIRRGSEAGERYPALLSARKNVSSDGTRPFIPPPTREQLMAGAANLRRVYKVEA